MDDLLKKHTKLFAEFSVKLAQPTQNQPVLASVQPVEEDKDKKPEGVVVGLVEQQDADLNEKQQEVTLGSTQLQEELPIVVEQKPVQIEPATVVGTAPIQSRQAKPSVSSNDVMAEIKKSTAEELDRAYPAPNRYELTHRRLAILQVANQRLDESRMSLDFLRAPRNTFTVQTTRKT